jgi:hypothetical protein
VFDDESIFDYGVRKKNNYGREKQEGSTNDEVPTAFNLPFFTPTSCIRVYFTFH